MLQAFHVRRLVRNRQKAVRQIRKGDYMNKAKTLKFHRAVGAMLRTQREELGMTQGQVAKKLGVTFQLVQNVERGTKRGENGKTIPTPMSITRYVDFCQVLSIDPTTGINRILQGLSGRTA
jgi:DNA-binding XRE family transcriptional regulator